MRTKILLIGLVATSLVTLFVFTHDWNPLPPGTTIDRILIEKSRRQLSIFQNGRRLKTYRVALGRNPIGPKEQEGDDKTPEGVYHIDERKADSDYHLALHLSFPNEQDTAGAVARGISAGSDIEIHGLPNDKNWIGPAHRQIDWTAGCIALTDAEIEELWRITPVGTMVEIVP